MQERLPLPPSDMVITFADITTSKQVLGFSPKTSPAEGEQTSQPTGIHISITSGIHLFVAWFKDYYNGRVEWEKTGRDVARNILLE